MEDFLDFKEDLTKLNKDELKELFLKLESYKLKYRSNIGVSENISFGVEIEFQNVALDYVKKTFALITDYKTWCIHNDCSVEDIIDGEIIGGEISSDILHDVKDDWFILYGVLNELKKLNAVAGDKTAFHVHVGAQIFKEDINYLKRFVKVWCIFENIIYRFGYGNTHLARPNISYFAAPIMSCFKELYNKNRKIFDYLSTTKMFDFGKEKGISFKNYHYLSAEEEVNNTIELRSPNGTLDYCIAQNIINFIIKLMLYVTSDRYDAKLIDNLFAKMKVKTFLDYSNLDLDKALMFCDLIFDNSLDKIYFLKQYIKPNDYFFLREFKK